MLAAAIATTEIIASGSPMNGTKSPTTMAITASVAGANAAAAGFVLVVEVTGLSMGSLFSNHQLGRWWGRGAVGTSADTTVGNPSFAG